MNPLLEILTTELAKTGVLPFARFMELALYCPEHGFYEREKDTVGRRGDFYTSVTVGPLFGQLLAFQFAEWLLELPIEDCRLRIVEAGAHDGKLAADVLTWLRQQRPALFAQLDYCLVEPSARRRQWQAATLHEFETTVQWADHLTNLAPHPFTIIFANELLDAFPVHRLGWDAQRQAWFEWGVALENETLAWARMSSPEIPNSKFQTPNVPPELAAILPDGFTTEVCPTATQWWRTAANHLRPGKLVTLDYGLTAEEFFHPTRQDGTLRAYRQHRVSAEVLTQIGEQDLTAHVNFSTLQAAGEAAGLKTETLVTQAKFLTSIAGKIWSAPTRFGEWTPTHTRQFQTLTHPEHLGRPFRVLVQSREPIRS